MSSEERSKMKLRGTTMKSNLIDGGLERKEVRKMNQDNRMEKYAEKENKDLKKTENSRNVKRFELY